MKPIIIILAVVFAVISAAYISAKTILKLSRPQEVSSAFILESEDLINGYSYQVVKHKETGRRFVCRYSGGICELHDKEAAQ